METRQIHRNKNLTFNKLLFQFVRWATPLCVKNTDISRWDGKNMGGVRQATAQNMLQIYFSRKKLFARVIYNKRKRKKGKRR